MKRTASPADNSWKRIAQRQQYKDLLRSKKAFLVPATCFFVGYFLALPVLVGWWPELMKMPVLGRLNAAYLLALSEFIMAWFTAFLYVRKASLWDAQVRQILSEEAANSKNKTA